MSGERARETERHTRDRVEKIDLSLCVDIDSTILSFKERQSAPGLTGMDITRLQPGSDSDMTRMNGRASRPSGRVLLAR